MNKYTKPTISLLPLSSSSAAASSCVIQGADKKELEDLFAIMGIPDIKQAFGFGEGCEIPVETYCKFTSAIQVFGS